MIKNKSNGILILLGICLSICLISCNSKKKALEIQNESITTQDNQKWIGALIKAYRSFNEAPNIESADLLFEASELMPKKNWENYLMVATVYAPNKKNDKAFDALEKALEAGLKDSELLNSLPPLSSLHNDSRWEALVSKASNKRKAYLKTIENHALLEALEKMWMLDQQALSEYEQNLKLLDSTATTEDYSRLFKPVENRWEINKQKLDSIINIHGWPGYKLVGEEGAKISWAIPQHHPDVFFKKKCLSLIKKSLEKGDTDANHYAELHDRIARETWQKQIFGASMRNDAPYPIEDPVNVNKRRLELGLPEPIEIYAYYHGIEYKVPNAEESKAELKLAYKNAQNHYTKFEEFAKKKNIDSANVHISKGISFYGDISNKQLYKAVIELAQINNKRSEHITLRILKVLIWRKWNGRHEILTQSEFNSLQSKQEWVKIEELLKMSK